MKSNRIILGSITIIVSLFLAWRIGLWLEPSPEEKAAITTRSPAASAPPFASGKVRETLPFELRDVKTPDGGASVVAVGIVRFDIDRGDVKPAVVAMLKLLKEKFPAARRLELTVSPSIDCPACKIAVASYDNGTVKLDYGTPTLKQMEESNSTIGAPSPSGKSADRPLLVRPDAEAYATGLNVMKAIEAAWKKSPGITEDQVLEQAATATGLSYIVVRRHRDFMTAYYSGSAFGSETFTF